jgi:hypothetical protein
MSRKRKYKRRSSLRSAPVPIPITSSLCGAHRPHVKLTCMRTSSAAAIKPGFAEPTSLCGQRLLASPRMPARSPLRTLAFLALPALALAARVPSAKRQSITTLSTAQINAFTPYTWFASTAYCSPSTTLAWSCGGAASTSPVRDAHALTYCMYLDTSYSELQRERWFPPARVRRRRE